MTTTRKLFLEGSLLVFILTGCSFSSSSSPTSSEEATTGCDSCATSSSSQGTSSEEGSVPSTSLPSSHSGSSSFSEDSDFTFALSNDSSGYIAISYGGNATSIVIPESYESKPVIGVGDYLFYQNAAILNVSLPNSLKTIGMAAFKGATQLYAIVLPSSLLSLGTDAFSGCSQLSSVTWASRSTASLTSIGNNAFEGCPLAQIDLPASLTEINSRAFADCLYLGRVDLYGSVPPIRANNSFEGCPSGLDFYVPSGALSAYQQSSSWSAYSTHLYNR